MNFKSLISQILLTDGYFKEKVSRTIDRNLTVRNWLFGFYIVEFEQNGEDRAEYGVALLDRASDELDIKGLSARSLKLFRQFYLSYPQIVQTVSALFTSSPIMQTLSAAFKTVSERTISITAEDYQVSPDKLIENLSFSHLVELIKIQEPLKRSKTKLER